MKAIDESYKWSGEKDGQLDTVRPNSQDVNISFYLKLRSYIADKLYVDSEEQMGGLEVI